MTQEAVLLWSRLSILLLLARVALTATACGWPEQYPSALAVSCYKDFAHAWIGGVFVAWRLLSRNAWDREAAKSFKGLFWLLGFGEIVCAAVQFTFSSLPPRP